MYTTDTNTKVVEFLNRAQTKLGIIASLVADRTAKGAIYDSYRSEVDLGFELHSFVLALDNNWNDWTEAQVIQYIDKWSAKANLNLTPYFEHNQYNLHISFDPIQVTELPSLASGYMWVGNSSNVATAVTITGAISISNAGVSALNSGIIVDANVNASAAIALTKLAAVTASRVIVSNASGFMEASSISATKLGYLANVTSDIQAQIDTKQASITTGDLTEATSSVLTITGGTDAVIGNVTIQVKQAGASQAGYLSSTDWNTFNNKIGGTVGDLTEVTSSVLTINGGANAILGSGASIQVKQAGASQSGYLSSTDWNTFNNAIGGGRPVKNPDNVQEYEVIKDIGDWNMDANQAVNVAHGLGVNFKKIRSVSVIIRNDSDSLYIPLDGVNVSTVALNGGVGSIDSTNINLQRTGSGQFDNTSYDSTSFNRGWVTIKYIA